MDPTTLLLAIVLIAVGFLLLAAELIFPSGTLLFLAVGFILAGIVLAFICDWIAGAVTLAVIVVAIGALGYCWPRTAVGRRFFLAAPSEEDTVAALPANQELERLRGRFGQAVSPLRPSGVTDFDGERVDTITEGMMVEEGQWVRCIDVQAGRVVVRPAEGPHAIDLETAIFTE